MAALGTSNGMHTEVVTTLASPQMQQPLPVRLSTRSHPPESILSSSGQHAGTDSGYSSQVVTPENEYPDSVRAKFRDALISPGKKLFSRKDTRLRVFEDEDVPIATQNRFSDLKELLSSPLYDCLSRSGRFHVKPISIKLKFLGSDTSPPKPYIVVLCDETVSKRVKHFFNQQQVKSDCKPNDPSLPAFELLICAKPPRPLAQVYALSRSTDDHNDLGSRTTLCGMPIQSESSQRATVGGLILARRPDGTRYLYAMTVEHFIVQDRWSLLGYDGSAPLDLSDDEDDSDASYILEDFQDSEEESSLEGYNHLSEPDEESSNASEKLGTWTALGEVTLKSSDAHQDANLDWALVDFEQAENILPNLIISGPSNYDLKQRDGSKEFDSRILGAVFTSRGVIYGDLDPSPSFLMLNGSKSLTKTYNLMLHNKQRLVAGDCGAWVFDVFSGEVYGHVVAADCFDEVYVVPIEHSMAQMIAALFFKNFQTSNKNALELTQVSLPTTEEIKKFAEDFMSAKKAQEATSSKKQTREDSPPCIPLEYLLGPNDLQPLSHDTLSSIFNQSSDSGYSSLNTSAVPSPQTICDTKAFATDDLASEQSAPNSFQVGSITDARKGGYSFQDLPPHVPLCRECHVCKSEIMEKLLGIQCPECGHVYCLLCSPVQSPTAYPIESSSPPRFSQQRTPGKSDNPLEQARGESSMKFYGRFHSLKSIFRKRAKSESSPKEGKAASWSALGILDQTSPSSDCELFPASRVEQRSPELPAPPGVRAKSSFLSSRG